jgi:hypothetical protein
MPEPTDEPRRHRFGQFKLPKNTRVVSFRIPCDDGKGDVPSRKWDGWWNDEIGDADESPEVE